MLVFVTVYTRYGYAEVDFNRYKSELQATPPESILSQSAKLIQSQTEDKPKVDESSKEKAAGDEVQNGSKEEEKKNADKKEENAENGQ